MNSHHRDEIQRQMEALRAALAQDLNGSIDSAKLLADWRYHFRKHPAVFCGVAAALGFIVVPRRPPAQTAVQVPVQAAGTVPTESQSIAAVLTAMALERAGALCGRCRQPARPHVAGAVFRATPGRRTRDLALIDDRQERGA